MPSVLITAFDPYDQWDENASWLALVELTRELPTEAEITTRLYPVELNAMKEKLAVDLRANRLGDKGIASAEWAGAQRIGLGKLEKKQRLRLLYAQSRPIFPQAQFGIPRTVR